MEGPNRLLPGAEVAAGAAPKGFDGALLAGAAVPAPNKFDGAAVVVVLPNSPPPPVELVAPAVPPNNDDAPEDVVVAGAAPPNKELPPPPAAVPAGDGPPDRRLKRDMAGRCICVEEGNEGARLRSTCVRLNPP